MKTAKNTLGIALVKEACPLCGHLEDGPIIMNTRLTEGRAKAVEDLNGKVIGFMEKPCKDCQDLMSKGYLLIGVVEDKSEKDMKNPYRSGNKWVVTHDFADRLFNGEPGTKGAAYIDVQAALKIGLPDVNLNA